MANYSTNQNRQFYVATSYADALTNAGAIAAKVKDNELYFLSKNLKTGEVIKSDRIQLKNLDYVKVISAVDMAKPLKKVEVTLTGTPITGQDYVLRITFFNWIGIGDDNIYIKDAAVHVTSDINDAKKLFDAMKVSLDNAFAREVNATKTSNPYLTFSVSGSSSSAKLVIEEKEQPWTLGVEEQERVNFTVAPTTVFDGTDDVIWGTATEGASTTTIKNGKKIADMEYFYIGERGDQYRMMGWPNVIPTQYCVDATHQYDVVELHFAFTDTGVNSYRSEKDITIVCDATAAGTTHTTAIDLVKAIQTGASITAQKSTNAATWTWT